MPFFLLFNFSVFSLHVIIHFKPKFLFKENPKGTNLKRLSGPVHLFNLAEPPSPPFNLAIFKKIFLPCLMPVHGYRYMLQLWKIF